MLRRAGANRDPLLSPTLPYKQDLGQGANGPQAGPRRLSGTSLTETSHRAARLGMTASGAPDV